MKQHGTACPRHSSDLVAAAIVACGALLLYLATLAPNVTLEDSGELIIGAALFGVPHPPGYPLWSFSGWVLTQILPWGSEAWRINLLSALFGAAASGVLTALVAHSGRWILCQLHPELSPSLRQLLPFFGGITAGFILAFSDVMWSQAVIAEVYTLNALFLNLVLFSFFQWMMAPKKRQWLLFSVLIFSLGLTNHHTLILILPAFLVAVFLFCRHLFPSFLIGFAFLGLSALALFSWYSRNPQLHQITQNFTWWILGGAWLLSFLWTRHFIKKAMLRGALASALFFLFFSTSLGGWFTVETSRGIGFFLLLVGAGGFLATSLLDRRLVLGMLLLGWLGLLPYGYMPLASQTNPPMDWGFARTNEGFYHSINRGQYPNNLASMIKKLASKVGMAPPASLSPTAPPGPSIHVARAIVAAVYQYGISLEDNFTLPLCLLALWLIFYLRLLGKDQRSWLAFLALSFGLLAFVMTLLEPPDFLDNAFLWATRVFTLQSHCIFVLAMGYGIITLMAYLFQRLPQLPSAVSSASLLLTLLPLQQNLIDCAQNGHWFGWQYGYDLLQPLEKNALLFGGTDSGRFVPTYMIFGESQQPDQYKRVPSFDRRDVFILTQNTLADPFYLDSLRAQYDGRYRPHSYTPFEQWLGRPSQYPQASLVLPTKKEEKAIRQQFALQKQAFCRPSSSNLEEVFALNGLFAKWIFEANKNHYPFYVQQSHPIEWMYPYMVPAGLLLKLHPEPLEALPPSSIEKDRAFWKAYTEKLLANPLLRFDFPARRSFSKLRLNLGDMYRARQLPEEALHAYAQAFAIAPDHFEVVHTYVFFLLERKAFEQAKQILQKALQYDPQSQRLAHLVQLTRTGKQLTEEVGILTQRLEQEPHNIFLQGDLLQKYLQLGQTNTFNQLLEKIVLEPSWPYEDLISLFEMLSQQGNTEQVLQLFAQRERVTPENSNLLYNFAACLAQQGRKQEALERLQKAVALDPENVLPSLKKDLRFSSLYQDPAFQQLVPSMAPISQLQPIPIHIHPLPKR